MLNLNFRYKKIMSHIEEEFEKIESEHGWNMLFRVSFIFFFFLSTFMKNVFFSIETCE